MYFENSGSRGREDNQLSTTESRHGKLAWFWGLVFVSGMAWFALYVSYTLLSLILVASDSFYGTTLHAFPRSLYVVFHTCRKL